MLVGVWITGGLFMTIAAMASGSEFVGVNGVWRLVIIVLSVIPIVTYILATYDGSLFALLVLTLGTLMQVETFSKAADYRNRTIKMRRPLPALATVAVTVQFLILSNH